jgi:hypothetical protein
MRENRTIEGNLQGPIRPTLRSVVFRAKRLGNHDMEDQSVFHRKPPEVPQPEVPQADLIDLLLNADEPTRRLLIFDALRAGTLRTGEAEEVMAQVMRLERAAAPRDAKLESDPKSHRQAA